MKPMSLSLVFLSLVGPASAGLLRAEELKSMPAPTLVQPEGAPVLIGAPAPGDPAVGGPVQPIRFGYGRNMPDVGWVQRPTCDCWATHNTVGTGSFKSEFMFIFSSSRTFFGEPCFKGTPRFPGTNYDNGNGSGSYPPCFRFGKNGGVGGTSCRGCP